MATFKRPILKVLLKDDRDRIAIDLSQFCVIPLVISKLIRSFLPISNRMSFSSLIVKSGFEAVR